MERIQIYSIQGKFMSFASLKKKSTSGNTASALLEKLNKSSNSYDDPRMYKPKKGADGSFNALIRFLPATDGEDSEFVTLFQHSFQGPKGEWYIENCRTTLGDKCMVCEANGELYRSGIESNKKIASTRSRRTRYLANILVLQDPASPENEGKVFVYSFGKVVMEKIREKAKEPELADEQSVDIFNFWSGSNFRLKIRKVDGQVSYDSSSFDAPSPLFNGEDAAIEELWTKQYKLSEFVADDQFKPREDLSRKFMSLYPDKYASAEASKTHSVPEPTPAPGVTSTPEPSIGEDEMDYYAAMLDG